MALMAATSGAAAINGEAAKPKKEKEFQSVPAQPVRRRAGLGNFLAKLKAGKEVGIACCGGSMTAGEGRRPKTWKWLRDA